MCSYKIKGSSAIATRGLVRSQLSVAGSELGGPQFGLSLCSAPASTGATSVCWLLNDMSFLIFGLVSDSFWRQSALLGQRRVLSFLDLSPSLVSTALLESRQVRFCEQFGLRSLYQLSEDGTMGEAVRVYHPCQGSPLWLRLQKR